MSGGRVVHRGPGWFYVGALPVRERCEAQAVTFALLRLWYARAFYALGPGA